MKILFLLTNYPGFGGIEKVTTYISSYLLKKGYELYVLSYGSTAPELIDALPSEIHLTFVPKPMQYDSDDNINYMYQYLKQYDFDYIVWQDSYAPIEQFLLKIDYPWEQKLIIVEHNSPMYSLKTVNSYFYYKNGLMYFLKRICKYPFSICKAYNTSKKRHSFVFENCKKYVLLSDSYRQELQQLVKKWDDGKVVSIKNPLTIEPTALDSFNKKKQILFVGRMTEQKGINFLLTVWKAFLKRNYKEWSLVILGDGHKRLEIEETIRKYRLNNIRIENPTSDIAKYYEESSILAMTSIFEGFPLVLAEAMSRGCVPVAFDSFKSAKDIIDNTKNGMLIKPFSIKKYVDCLEDLIRHDVKLKDMSFAAKESIIKFDIENIGNQWIELFDN